jgi:hypothetical protein
MGHVDERLEMACILNSTTAGLLHCSRYLEMYRIIVHDRIVKLSSGTSLRHTHIISDSDVDSLIIRCNLASNWSVERTAAPQRAEEDAVETVREALYFTITENSATCTSALARWRFEEETANISSILPGDQIIFTELSTLDEVALRQFGGGIRHDGTRKVGCPGDDLIRTRDAVMQS